MQMKKEVLRKRLQRKLDKILLEKEQCETQWPAFRDALVRYYLTTSELIAGTSNRKELDKLVYPVRPECPRLPYNREEALKSVERNLRILDAIEGETIEVERLRTGRNFTLESIFDEEI